MEYREWLTPLTYNHLIGMAILTNTKEIITIAYGVQRIVDPTDSQSFVWHGQIEKYQRNFTHQSNCDGSLAHKKRGKKRYLKHAHCFLIFFKKNKNRE